LSLGQGAADLRVSVSASEPDVYFVFLAVALVEIVPCSQPISDDQDTAIRENGGSVPVLDVSVAVTVTTGERAQNKANSGPRFCYGPFCLRELRGLRGQTPGPGEGGRESGPAAAATESTARAGE
jgi:hypothetical protein